jgi:hypothetical protein
MIPLRVSVLALCLATGLAVPGIAPAQPSDSLRAHPGYVDVAQIESWFGTSASLQVDVHGPILDRVARSTAESDADFSRLVDGLEAIQVRGFPMQGTDSDEVRRRLETFAQELEARGWQRVVYVRDGNEVARIFLRPDPERSDERVAGLTVLAVDPADEAVVVNIVGPMAPDQLQRLGSNLQIETLRTLDAGREQ